MEKEIYNKIEKFINDNLELTSNIIDNESKKHINHYLQHNELEMAFEILFTEIMKNNSDVKIDFSATIEIGNLLNLEHESVFNPYFWQEFILYTKGKGW